jgi:hypothetical protein
MPAESRLKAVGLFAGIGGLELGLTKAGHEIVFLCEIDPAARAVLKKRFDGIEIKEDIRLIPKLPRETDLVVAGFPCQDLSQVGQTHGMREEIFDREPGVQAAGKDSRAMGLAGERALHAPPRAWSCDPTDNIPPRESRLFLGLSHSRYARIRASPKTRTRFSACRIE